MRPDLVPLALSSPSITTTFLEAIKNQIAHVGFAYIENLTDEFDYATELTKLGDPLPQYMGELVRDIKPDPKRETGVYSALSMDELTPHTEWYEFEGAPPRYVALWCVQPVQGLGGETTLADGYAFLNEFSDADLALMRERTYEWYALPSDQRVAGSPDPVLHPILEDNTGGLLLRYSNQYVQRVEDGLIPRYIDNGKAFFVNNHIAISIAKGDLLIWDNWRMIHARNSFEDPNRHLRRMLLMAPSA